MKPPSNNANCRAGFENGSCVMISVCFCRVLLVGTRSGPEPSLWLPWTRALSVLRIIAIHDCWHRVVEMYTVSFFKMMKLKWTVLLGCPCSLCRTLCSTESIGLGDELSFMIQSAQVVWGLQAYTTPSRSESRSVNQRTWTWSLEASQKVREKQSHFFWL